MANDVVLSAASRSNLLSLQNTQKSIDATQLRLATGKKVNSALDNPQSFFQSQSLSNRASDLTRLLDGIGQSIRSIQEADKGVTALNTLVEQANSVAESAAAEAKAAEGFSQIRSTKDLTTVNLTTGSGGTIVAGDNFIISAKKADGTTVTSGTIAVAANDTISNLVGKINADTGINATVRASVDSNGKFTLTSLSEGATVRITDGAQTLGADGYAFLGLDGYVGSESTVATTRQGGTAIAGHTLTSNAAAAATKSATTGKYLASAQLGAAGFISAADGQTLTLTVDGVSAAIGTFLDTDTIGDVVEKINGSTLGLSVSAKFDADTGKITLDYGDNVSTADIKFTATTTTSTASFGFGSGAADGASAAIGDAKSEHYVFSGSSANLKQYETDYNKLRSQIDAITEDAAYQGVNLLKGDNLTTYFNEDRSNNLVTTGVDFTAAGLGLTKADFTNSGTVQKSIDQTRNATNTIRSFGSSIANDLSIIQTRQTFTNETINTLKAGSADLVNADLNEEGANLLALQTAQQLGVTSLSLASQSQQAVLRLF